MQIHSVCQLNIDLKPNNVRVIPDAGDVEIVGADIIAKLSAETSENRSVAAWDQRIVIRRVSVKVQLQVYGTQWRKFVRNNV